MTIEEHAATRTTRRTVVKTGAKLAYAAPLVAASLHLNRFGALAQDVCDGAPNEISPKQLEGCCYTCKIPESGCVASQSNVQAADLLPGVDGGLACICQGNTCIINDIEFEQGDNVTAGTNGACAPVIVPGTTCGGGAGTVAPPE